MSSQIKPIKSASLLLNKGIAYLAAVSKTNFLYIKTPPFIKVAWKEQSVFQKHEMIFQIINASQSGIPFPKDPKSYSEYVLSQFGESSYNKMEKGGMYCNIDLYGDGTISFTPNIFKNGGFEGTGGDEKIEANADPYSFISVLEKVLERCKV